MIETAPPKEEEDKKLSPPSTLSESSSSLIQENAKYFVYGFYSKFNYDPLTVVECYVPDAIRIYEDIQYQGRERIRQLLTNIKEQDPEVEIRELNATRTVGHTTQVHLIGEYKCGDKTTFRRFTQSFILVGNDVDNFRIASDITSFGFQIRGIAKKRQRNALGGYRVMDNSSDGHEVEKVGKKGKYHKGGRANKKRYYKRKNGKQAAPKVEVKTEVPENAKPNAVANQPKVKKESSDIQPKSGATSSVSAMNTGTPSSSVPSVKPEENGKASNNDNNNVNGKSRGSYRPRRWQNRKDKNANKPKVALPLVSSSPTTSR